MGDIKGRVAIVTGGGSGIGRAVVQRFSRDGAIPVVADVNLEAAEKVAARIREEGGQALAVEVDVSDKARVESMVEKTINAFNRIDILINNAGVAGPNCPVVEIEEADWDRTMDINLKSVFLCSQAVIPVMVERGWGRIVSLSSVAGREGNAGMAPYAVSKIGIIGFTMVLAKEVATKGVTINCISPTITATEFIQTVPKETIEQLMPKIPMRRMAQPQEVAGLIRYLVSEEAAFITGQCYDISGGRSVY
ncbi:MAG: SDR family oxidoreductase [Anaerolineales bacterium]|nr:SDR family oxidoreductase [Anaerolineales bacterium]